MCACVQGTVSHWTDYCIAMTSDHDHLPQRSLLFSIETVVWHRATSICAPSLPSASSSSYHFRNQTSKSFSAFKRTKYSLPSIARRILSFSDGDPYLLTDRQYRHNPCLSYCRPWHSRSSYGYQGQLIIGNKGGMPPLACRLE